jgi:2-methylcitrate dehydratase PrpD
MTVPNSAISSVLSFVHDLRIASVPDEIRQHVRQCVLDTLGVAVAGSALPIADIVRKFAVNHLGSGQGCGARLLLDGRRAGVPGAAFATAAIIDGYDAHDGHVLCKGHVGVTALAASLAFADYGAIQDWDTFLECVLIGYEVGTRAGIALHASSPVFHSSGAWNALAAAAVGARALKLSPEQTHHALGIAEYYGPRSPLMRVIEHPTMVKDGSAMGAFAGVSAAILAADGFTGAPAVTVVDGKENGPDGLWCDLGSKWRILEQYVKPLPVCRWTQPAAAAVFALQKQNLYLSHEDIELVEVESFHEAVSLSCREPLETDAAQYSLPFVVASSLVHGRLTPTEMAGEGLTDPHVLRLSRSMKLTERDEYNALFPSERWGRVRLTLKDGRHLNSDAHTTVGDPATPLGEAVIAAKFVANCAPTLGESAARRLESWVKAAEPGTFTAMLDAVLSPPAEMAPTF